MPRLSNYHDVTKDLNPDDYTMEEIQKQIGHIQPLVLS